MMGSDSFQNILKRSDFYRPMVRDGDVMLATLLGG